MTTAGSSFSCSWRRITALLLRYLYLLRGSWPRVLELAYWPTVQMILWGLITQFFVTHSSWLMQAGGALIAAVLLWDVLFRSQIGVSISFLEEMWSRNLGQLFVSPLRPWEFVVSLLATSLPLLHSRDRGSTLPTPESVLTMNSTCAGCSIHSESTHLVSCLDTQMTKPRPPFQIFWMAMPMTSSTPYGNTFRMVIYD